MAGTVQRLRDALTTATELAAGVMKKADDDERELSAEERDEVDKALGEARSIKARLGRAEDNDKLQAEISALLTEGRKAIPASTASGTSLAVITGSGGLKSAGQQWVESVAMEYFKQGRHRGLAAWQTDPVELMAATLTSDPASGGDLVQTQLQSGILPLPLQPPRVANLFAQGTTTSASITYLKETTATNAADAVAEGAAKPESTLIFDSIVEAVRKVATWLPVSEEMLADVDQIRSYIDARLMLFVAIAIDREVLSGSGVAPHMLGILTNTGLATTVAAGATEANADAIFRSLMTVLAESMLMPDGIVLHPADWAKAVLAKNSGGDYLAAGAPYASLPAPTLWGLPVVATTAITQGTGLTGAFKAGGQFWRRSGITVQASNSHSDYFVKNLVAIRAEQRALLTVYRPKAFGKVTGLDSGIVAPVLARGSSESEEDEGNGGRKPAKR
jgi:HK97 family phage major capsid protein